MQVSDEALMLAYQDEGDPEAFEELVRRHRTRIFTYLVHLVGDRERANDLFQETFMRVIETARKGRYRPDARWLAWVLRIARNLAMDEFRRRQRWQLEPVGEMKADANPESKLEHAEMKAWLERSIAQLPPAQQEVLFLRHHAGLTFREIAELTDTSINTALGRMRYALQHLRRKLAQTEWNPNAHE